MIGHHRGNFGPALDPPEPPPSALELVEAYFQSGQYKPVALDILSGGAFLNLCEYVEASNHDQPFYELLEQVMTMGLQMGLDQERENRGYEAMYLEEKRWQAESLAVQVLKDYPWGAEV